MSAPRFRTPYEGDPHDGDPARDLVWLGAVGMYLTVFLALGGRGVPPREAAAVTLMMVGGAEVLRRLISDGRGGAGWGR
ncbi:hypothetical protein AGRA3207_004084 [Actinomadura graeca]|uniref:Uncharacterized protein n=1 Tax=Actinomadura graeca TaxID=2750812 RepID=A0ABX8QW91_9ACTN|nr:hypothetical protein [Actinomadura graeca]QXJ22993.1 hypothetical protein AGRA3207_004084 [Actinomadura graeca]